MKESAIRRGIFHNILKAWAFTEPVLTTDKKRLTVSAQGAVYSSEGGDGFSQLSTLNSSL